MARLFYTVLYYLLLPFILLRLWLRGRRAPAYRERVGERFGCFPPVTLRQPIWVHAVSVGETIAAATMIKRLQQEYPDSDMVVTTMTPTGSERVQAIFGGSVFHVYAPYDMPGSIQRFLARVNPRLLIIMETELWPNTIHYCHRQGIPVVVANARLSAKSARGYEKFSALTGPMLQELALVVAQSGDDASRFNALGLPAQSTSVSGSIKFDINLDIKLQQQAAALKQSWGENRPVWIAASTHQGEDELLLQAHQQLLSAHPSLLLVLVPRHPERFNRVADLIAGAGLRGQRRSQGGAPEPATQVLLGDTMGELLLLLGAADIAFVGGSLVQNGGHNMLEPAAWALPIVTGMSDFNFAEISHKLQQQHALVKVEGAEAMIKVLGEWLHNTEAREKAGQAAAQVVAENRGALEKLLGAIKTFL